MKNKCPPNPGYLVNGDDSGGKTACVKRKITSAIRPA